MTSRTSIFPVILLFTLASISCAPEAGIEISEQEHGPGEQLLSALRYYVEAQEALAADDFGAAREALEALAGETNGRIRELAAESAEAQDLAQMRRTFMALSEEVIDGFELPGEIGVVSCPMADDNQGARWVQRRGDVRNPYYGESMLTCGVFVEGG